ncbi:MAG: class I SAM-dependent methyltransferase [bacterium]
MNGDKYFIKENIINLKQNHLTTHRKVYPHEKKFKKLVEVAQEKGWFNAIVELYHEDTNIINYSVNKRRADFIYLLPTDKKSIIFDFGCGLGLTTHMLAANAYKTYAMDNLFEQVQFSSLRVNQEGYRNVHFVCGGNDGRLPFRNNFFDIIILNFVFQWAASNYNNVNPLSLQKRLLFEIKRVLKKEGTLYLGVPNRFALKYILGEPDEHSFGSKYTTVLPYFLSDIIVKKKLGHHYTARCYSYFEYSSMLKKTGFRNVKFYAIIPDHRNPERIIPFELLKKNSKYSIALFKKGLAGNCLTSCFFKYLPVTISKYFVYHYGIICKL